MYKTLGISIAVCVKVLREAAVHFLQKEHETKFVSDRAFRHTHAADRQHTETSLLVREYLKTQHSVYKPNDHTASYTRVVSEEILDGHDKEQDKPYPPAGENR